MQTKKLYPHFTEAVKALQFVEISNPSSITSYTQLLEYGEDNFYDLENPEEGISVSYTDTDLIVVIDRALRLNFNWNSIIARADDSEESSSYLSLSYWDYVISENANFDYLKIKYSSSYKVVPSTDAVSVEVSYIQHDIYEGTSVDNSDKWRSHLNMNREVSGTLYNKTLWTAGNPGSYPDAHKVNSSSDNQLSTWDSNSSGTKNSIDISSNTQGVSVKNATYECIPECITQGSKLMVSPRFGVEFYNPSNGNIVNQVSTSSGPEAPMKPDYPDGINQNENFEIYRVYKNVFLFYVPERYAAWISNEVINSQNVIEWNTWRIGDDHIKVVIPSYFDIIPFVFMQKIDDQNIGEWRISYIMRVCDTVSDMFSTYSDVNYDVSTDVQRPYPADNSNKYNAIPVEVFFSNINFIQQYLQNTLMGYSSAYADKIKKYFYSQLYISYHTFIQALRMNEYYGSNPQMCDCGIKLGKFFIPYSQDVITDGSSSVKRTSSPIEVGEGYIVDNMIAYLNGNLVSLYSGNLKSVSESDVQMHHGIIVGWNGSRYVQLQ